MPEYVQKELLKLHGIEFHSNIIIIEEATSTRIKRPDGQKTGISRNRLTEPHTQGSITENNAAVNYSSENVDFIRANTVPGNKSYADVAMSRKIKNGITKKVIVFGDSIIRGIRVRDFNQQVKNGYAKFRSFADCNSKEMLHSIEPTLETGFYASAILLLGVNNLLNNKSPSGTDDLVSNLVKIVNKCKYFGVMIFLFLELLLTKDSHTLLLKRLMKKL